MSSEEQKIKHNDKITNVSEEISKKNDIEIKVKNNKFIPLINYKLNPILSSSILNYLAIGISSAIYGCEKLDFFKLQLNRTFYLNYYFISSIILYTTGIFDWYDGKDLLYLIDFIFSFFFFSEYISGSSIEFFKVIEPAENERLRGTFFVAIFLLFLCIAISYINKGKIYIVNQAAIVVGFIFLFLYKYFEKEWIEKVYSYTFIVIGGLFWITALLKMINNLKTDDNFSFMSPSD